MMANPVNVVEALRRSKKGQLKYEPRGVADLKEQLLDLKCRQSSLAFGYPYNNFSDVVSCKVIEDNSNENSEATTESQVDDANESPRPVQYEITEEILWDIKIFNYEEEYRQRAQKAIDKRIRKFIQHTRMVREDQKRKIKAIEEKRNMELRSQREQHLAQLQARNEEMAELKRIQEERLAQSMKLMEEKIKELERRQKQIDEEAQERMRLEKLQEDLATAVHQCEKEMKVQYHKMAEALKHCSDITLLADSTKEDVVKYNDVITAFNQIVDAAKTSSLSSDDGTKAVSLVQKFEECVKNIVDAIEKANEAKEQLINAQKNAVRESSMSLYQNMASMLLHQAREDQNRIWDQTSIDLSSQTSPPQITNKVVNVEQTSSLQHPRTVENSDIPKYYTGCPDYSLFVSPKALEEDIYLQNFLRNVQNSYQSLKKDKRAEMKTYRFQLQKAVNIPVNTISSLSADHLKDKFEKLRKLLSGHPVDVSGHHPMAVSFCKDLVAKQIVKQGEKQVSCKHGGVFAVAAIVVGLWIDFPDFGDLLLAHFHQKCPFIIPFYIPHTEGQTEEEHYKALGYNYIDGKIEEQDKYLKRMSGIMRLYSAILCTRIPHGMNRHHPHGIEHGWKWMARILNLEPRVDITATMLYDFLETAGFAMEAAYKNQFEKLMSALCDDFFPKLKSVSAGGTGGPFTRLENFLENYRTNRHIPKPSGMLPENFWF